MMSEWLLAAAILAIIIVIYLMTKEQMYPGFSIGGYPLGSYDPNKYPSEITREPFTPVHFSMLPYLGPEFNRYPTPSIKIYPHQ